MLNSRIAKGKALKAEKAAKAASADDPESGASAYM